MGVKGVSNWTKEDQAKSKKKYNDSEKGKKKNREQAAKYRANPENRHRLRQFNWNQRGLKYYPADIHIQYELPQICSFCPDKPLKKNWMEHNHTTGSFRGWTCNSCNGHLGWTDKYFNMVMRELKLLFNLPNVLKI
tara:strand:+ start:553 stop:960 length:408 start_codon:yes stop_codon:yes gene_type:complete